MLLEYKNGIELVYENIYKRHCYLVLADFIVDYKEQFFIICNKVNIQCLICHVLA